MEGAPGCDGCRRGWMGCETAQARAIGDCTGGMYLIPDGMEVGMALIKCPECQKDVSDAAYDCPGCGCPLKRRKNETVYAHTVSESAGGFWYGFKKTMQWFVIIVLSLVIISFVASFFRAGTGDEIPPAASRPSDVSAEKAAALMLNLNGHLCAEAVRITPLKQPKVYEVRCIEYRGGTGTVDYVLDMNTGVGWRR